MWIRANAAEASNKAMTVGREPNSFKVELHRLDELASSDAKTNGIHRGNERQPLVKSWLQFEHDGKLTTGSFGFERKDDWDNIYRVAIKSN